MEWSNLPKICLSNKLKILKDPMIKWCREKFGQVDNKICNLEAVIHKLLVVSKERDLNDMEKARLIAAENQLQS